MFYGFDATTLKCLWAIAYDTPPTANVIVVETNEPVEIQHAMLEIDEDGTYHIATIPTTPGDVLSGYSAIRNTRLREAKDQIDMLTDVVELTPSKTASAQLQAWKKYRVDLYNMDLSALDKVVWPNQPTVE